MYWLGSVGAVGSWFFNSLTSSVRKSLAVIVDPPPFAWLPLALAPELPLEDALAKGAGLEDAEEIRPAEGCIKAFATALALFLPPAISGSARF